MDDPLAGGDSLYDENLINGKAKRLGNDSDDDDDSSSSCNSEDRRLCTAYVDKSGPFAPSMVGDSMVLVGEKSLG